MGKVFIFSTRIARDLIRNNYSIIDLAENQKFKGKTVYVFNKTDDIVKYLEQKHNITLPKTNTLSKKV